MGLANMDERFWSTIDNTSEVSGNLQEILHSTVVTELTTSISPVRSGVTARLVVAVMGLIVSSIGVCANTVVLAVLYRARKRAGSSVHTLIANQSAIDLFTCVFVMSDIVKSFTYYFKYDGNRILDGAIWTVFQRDNGDIGNEKMFPINHKVITQSCTDQLLSQE